MSQIAARERTFSRSLLEIERLAGRKGRLLDIGTAAGAFLAVARSQGWQVDGVSCSERSHPPGKIPPDDNF